MKDAIVLLVASLAAVNAWPVYSAPEVVAREVPQEHSHQQFIDTVQKSLQANNPNNIGNPVFGLLGNAAAKGGLGKLKDTECLQQQTADQAFTNAKKAKDVAGMSAALIYRALERNTGSVGLKSNSCTSAKAVNPQIAAISQHQDPASKGAAAANKAVTLALAKQIASVGGDPQDALKSGTFKPGKIGDPTAKGNTCDVQNDAKGCIFTQNLLNPDATADEIKSAAGAKGSQAAQSGNAAQSSNAAESGSASQSGNAAETSNAAVTTAAAAVSTAAAVTTAAGGDAASASASGTDAANSAQASGANQDQAASASGSSQQAASNTASANNAAASGNGAALNFGSAKCADPAIAFGVGFDGRKEASFEPDDKATFQHGSAQNAGIVAQFICDRLQDQCKAPAATVNKCRAAQKQVNGQKNAAAADTFNKALGVKASKVGVDEKAA